MNRKSPLNKKNIILYLLMATGFWLLRVLAVHSNHDAPFERTINDLWRLSFAVVLHFLLLEYSLPFIAKKRTSILYNILIAIPVIFLYLILYSWLSHAWRLLGIAIGIYTPLIIFSSVDEAVSSQMAFSMMTLFFFVLVRHIYHYTLLRQATQKLRIEKQQAELNYLKSQTNPHFLFNTLNNIYSLTRIKSDLAPESILRLSKILRFMLYETTGNYIAVEQELKIMADYIELEKLRYDETLLINFNHDVENMKQSLPPLLLIPLVENAFKHGASETRGHPYVDIHLSIRDRQLTLVVKNSSEAAAGEPVTESIGLSNLRRQLELLYTDFSLSVQHGTGVFTAILKINLASYV
jgi:two-component system, LytTR family, sensor kinase